jgi:hypothetical protein
MMSSVAEIGRRRWLSKSGAAEFSKNIEGKVAEV